MNWMEKLDNSWTLFLDRDGVINAESDEDYIRNWESFSIFNRIFNRIIIVTNQKGVGKGLMSEEDLLIINRNLTEAVRNAGGEISKIYYCTALEETAPCRKPNNGMALQARKDFPEIDFSKSLMAGNTVGDMQFGRTTGMFTVFIRSEKPIPPLPNDLIDTVFDNLHTLAKALQKSVAAK
jgi:D-glycero-D-manno-heptose 1,7-bisphosphate phosphatase